MNLRRLVVIGLERACPFTHPVVHRLPFYLLRLPLCPLATLSAWLDDRWDTVVWARPEEHRESSY